MSNLQKGARLVKDVFDSKTFKMLDEESCDTLDHPDTDYHVNKANWTASSPEISNWGQAGTIITTPVSEQTKQLFLDVIAKHTEFDIDPDAKSSRFRHTYMFRGAFIPWHPDPHCDIACTFYFQDVHVDHGGTYLYSDIEDPQEFLQAKDKKIHGISPAKNTMLLQHEVLHCVTPLTPMTPVRRSIQAFLAFAK